MKIKLIMADPAGNRTAIVRTPVPAEQRAQIAAKILGIPELRAEQAGFETAPRLGGAGRLEMMGGEFCGNAARSYGYLLWQERNSAAGLQAADDRVEAAEPSCGCRESAPADHSRGNAAENTAVASQPAGSLRIEISGSAQPLEVDCDLEKGTSYAQMPLPNEILYTSEGYPMVVSEGITHVILQNMDPDEDLIRRLVEEYGDRWDAFGMMFLKGDCLTPVVYVRDAGSLVYESSCGSGSLAAAWYMDWVERKENNCSVDVDVVDGSSEIDSCNGLHPSAPRQTTVYCFQEPGGKIAVRFSYGMDCEVVACMGGMISLEEELDISL